MPIHDAIVCAIDFSVNVETVRAGLAEVHAPFDRLKARTELKIA
jgi:hypothetical protein